MGCCAGSPSQETESAKSRKDTIYTRRSVCCTDIFFLLLFVAFWCLLLYIAVLAFMQGDGRRLLFGYDSFGNTCNKKVNYEIENLNNSGRDTDGLPNVFFMRMDHPRQAMQVCIKTCPDKLIQTPEEALDFTRRTDSRLCRYDIEPDDYLKQKWTSNTGPCPKLPIYKSISLVSRCVPDPSQLAQSLFMDSLVDAAINKTEAVVRRQQSTERFLELIELDDVFQKFLSDIYIAWRQIIALCGIAVVIAFLMVLMMRILAAIIVWLIVILAACGSLVGTGFLWWTYYQEHTQHNEDHKLTIPVLRIDVQNERAFLIFSIVASVLTLILLLILLVMRKRIALVVALFHEAGKCLANIPLLLIQPFWTFVVLFIFFMYWLIVMAFIATMGKAEANSDNGFPSVKYVTHGFVTHFWWIHAIGLIWTSEFILASQQFVIASTVAFWYFSAEKSKMCCAVFTSINRLLLHHLGSVAFGSLIITLVKIPRYILMYIERKCKASQNQCAQCCLKCCICCLYCLEKCLKFLNQNAYTIIAIDGNSFCHSAQRAFSILTSNVLRVIAINSVGAFVLFLGKVGVMATTCAIAVVWLKTIPGMHFYAIPVILISFFSFLIAHCFLSVYEMVVDALLLCFCEDCSMNDGTPGREHYMSTSLMEFVQNSSSKIELLNKSKVRHRGADKVDAGQATELKQMNA